MKHFTYLLTGLLWAFSAISTLAQEPITLIQNNFPATPTAVEYYFPSNQLNISVPQPGVNQVWDYSTLTPDSDRVEVRYAAVSGGTPLPNATRKLDLYSYSYSTIKNPVHYTDRGCCRTL